MSHHAQLSPEALQTLQNQKRKSSIIAILIAISITALIAASLYFIAIAALFKNEESLISYNSQSNAVEEITRPEMTNEVEKKPSAPSSAMAKVIAANTPSPVAMIVPKDQVLEPSLDFGNGSDFGDGWGGAGSGDAMGGGGKNTPFGRTGGSGLKGSFYDLKQDRKNIPTQLAADYKNNRRIMSRIPYYMRDIKKVHRANYSEKALKDYYKASVELTFTLLAIPKQDAAIAPVAFGVEQEVEASGWLIVYEGTLEANAPKRLKFTGRFDDLLIVQVNDKTVFEGSWSNYTGELNENNEINGPSMIHNEMIQGDKWIDFNKGDRIRILVGESPGGHLGGGLFVAEEGVKYEKNSAGHDILPPFATMPLTTEDIERLESYSYPMELEDIPIFSMK